MIKEGCQCFTCRHGDEPRVVAGYLQGYIEACDWFLNWAKENNIKAGSIADNDLSGIVAQMECNRTESACLLSSPEIPDIEKVDLQQVATMELRDQLEAKEQMIKNLKAELKRAEVYLECVEYETSALGGKEKDMERALLNIDRYCRDYFGD